MNLFKVTNINDLTDGLYKYYIHKVYPSDNNTISIDMDLVNDDKEISHVTMDGTLFIIEDKLNIKGSFIKKHNILELITD